MLKVCPVCHTEFETNSSRKICCSRPCIKKWWLINNKDRWQKYYTEYRQDNKGRVSQRQREYRVENREALQSKAQAKWLENKDKIMEERHNSPNFKEVHDKASKAWKKRNYQKILDNSNHRYKTDLAFRLKAVLRARLRSALKNGLKTGSAVKDLGCTVIELRAHIESLWLSGMSWDNWSKTGWHIDHIKPLDSFDLSDPEQLRVACHYTNLQPLWASDNLKKSNKII